MIRSSFGEVPMRFQSGSNGDRWQVGGIYKGNKGNIGEEKEAKIDFIRKKCVVRLRICEKSSTFVAKMGFSRS